MLRRERTVGNYLPFFNFGFGQTQGGGARATMVLLIEELHSIKGYRELTLFSAVNIADHYLKRVSQRGQAAPNIITLGVSSLLLAAKTNESIGPNLKNMVYLINQKCPGQMTLTDLIAQERDILRTLDFDVHTETSITFLERFCQLLIFDEGLCGAANGHRRQTGFAAEVCQIARNLCRQSLHRAEFLQVRPSQVGAACLLLAINSLSQQNGYQLGSFEPFTADMTMSDEGSSLQAEIAAAASDCVLAKWTDKISQLTGLTRVRDIKPAYTALLHSLAEQGMAAGIITTSSSLAKLMPSCGQNDDSCCGMK